MPYILIIKTFYFHKLVGYLKKMLLFSIILLLFTVINKKFLKYLFEHKLFERILLFKYMNKLTFKHIIRDSDG